MEQWLPKYVLWYSFPGDGNRQDLKKVYAWVYQVAADFYLSAWATITKFHRALFLVCRLLPSFCVFIWQREGTQANLPILWRELFSLPIGDTHILDTLNGGHWKDNGNKVTSIRGDCHPPLMGIFKNKRECCCYNTITLSSLHFSSALLK